MVLSFFASFGWGCVYHISVGWCCLASSFFGSWCFLSCTLWAGAFCREPAPPIRGEGRQHDQKEEEGKPLHPKRGRESRTTEREDHSPELNLTSVNFTNLNFLQSFYFLSRERHHPTGKRRKINTTQRETGEKHSHTMWEERSRPGCQGPQRKCAGYLSTTSWKLKLSGSGKNKVIREMEMKKKKK